MSLSASRLGASVDFPIQNNGGPWRRQTPLCLAARKTTGSLPQFVPNWVFRPLSACHVRLLPLQALRVGKYRKNPPDARSRKASDKREKN